MVGIVLLVLGLVHDSTETVLAGSRSTGRTLNVIELGIRALLEGD